MVWKQLQQQVNPLTPTVTIWVQL